MGKCCKIPSHLVAVSDFNIGRGHAGKDLLDVLHESSGSKKKEESDQEESAKN
ncbi:MAG TPA: hypothetical protein VF817_00700 [Patescibacteria group bacterium]